MLKSKHSGWTWDLKRTPFGGGGGGGWNPVAAITNPISQALGTSGGGGGLLGGLASIDPGPAVGSALASTDKFMTNLTPYGWALPAALVAAYFSGGGTLAAEGAAEAGAAAAGEAAATEAASAAGEAAFSEAVAAGASNEAAAAAANAAADSALAASTGSQTGAGLTALESSGGTGLTGGAGGSTGLLSGGTTSGLTIPGGAGIAVDPAIAAGSGAGIGSAGAIGGGTVGGLSAGASSGAGSLSSQLAPGTILGTGAPGAGEIGVSYAAGGNGLPATDFFGNYIPASSVGFGGVPNTVTGTGLSDALRTGNQVRQGASAANSLSKLLSQGAGSGLSSSLGKLAQGANPAGTALTSPIHNNANPFAQEQYFQVSNPTSQNQVLSTLLKQG
jgi:hypothetical protein